jgi:hypothetical protein
MVKKEALLLLQNSAPISRNLYFKMVFANPEFMGIIENINKL